MTAANSTNKLFFVFIALIIAGLFYLLGPILTPFLVGALLAYLVDPLVQQLMRLRLPRLLAVIIVFLTLFSLIILLIFLCVPLIEAQIITLMKVIPKVIDWLQNHLVSWANHFFGTNDFINIEQIKQTLAGNITKASGVVGWFLKTILHSGAAVVFWATTLFIIPVVTFYLLRDWNKLIVGLRRLLPRSIEPVVVRLAVECDSVLSAFFRGQLLVMISLAIIYSVGLTLVGLEVGVMIGLIAGLLSIVPYLGFIIGIVTASIMAFVQFGTMTPVVLVWVVFAIGQFLESTLLTPNLVGDRIGLHPVAVIFAVLTGGALFGFFGVLLALPVAAVVMVLIRFLYQHYRHSQLYQ